MWSKGCNRLDIVVLAVAGIAQAEFAIVPGCNRSIMSAVM